MEYREQYEKVSTESEEYDLIEDMNLFASQNPDFDPSFLDSIGEFGKKNGFISSGQYNSLLKVYRAFRMHEPKPID